ncbi:MAG: hypothetical protein GC161_09860 [Planctomycetaceae bacterium]|nr:hypothetical protein [Planctomycetaceae bacterium]
MARLRPALAPLVALCLAFAPGCRTPQAAAWNLRELHALDGSTQRVGRVQTHTEFALRRTLVGLLRSGSDSDWGPAGKPAKQVSRPLDRTLKELLILASFDGEHAPTGGLQVELFAWLGRQDVYDLARERSVIELVKAGRRLGLERPEQVPEGATSATADQVQEAARALWAAAERGTGLDLDNALTALEALPLDLDGSRRALAAVNIALESPRPEPAERRLVAASLFLQRRTVALAVGDALMDEEGLVRGAALRGAATWSPAARDELLRAWGNSPQDSFDGHPEVLRAVAELVADGVPEGDDLEPWLDRLYVIAEQGDGRASVAACRALGRLLPDSPPSLRPEDWLLVILERDGLVGDALEGNVSDGEAGL